MLRSIMAVAIAIAVWGVLWVLTGMGLSAAMPASFDESGVTTAPALLALMIVISSLLSVFAGWLCATMATHSQMKHVWVLALIQLGIGILVQTGVWDQMPLWYHVIFLAVVVPMHLVGGRIRVGRTPADLATIGAA